MPPTRPARRNSALRRTALSGATLLACTLVLSACDSGTGAGSSKDTGRVTDADGIVSVRKSDRTSAPELSGKDLRGSALDVRAAYRGKVVVVNFWGSWCPPCREEAKNLVRVSGQLAPKGVEFVGINTRDRPGPARAFEKDHGVPYRSLDDPTGKLLLRFPPGTLNPQTLPSTVVLDRNGKIAARRAGAISEAQLHKMIDPVIAEK
ncbi:TlpA family protein disulfide reductase [Streptomyces sp. NBC_01766]|nr:TlpA family protein disulfide reductase [Streptomyces sp. NBC_01766]